MAETAGFSGSAMCTRHHHTEGTICTSPPVTACAGTVTCLASARWGLSRLAAGWQSSTLMAHTFGIHYYCNDGSADPIACLLPDSRHRRRRRDGLVASLCQAAGDFSSRIVCINRRIIMLQERRVARRLELALELEESSSAWPRKLKPSALWAAGKWNLTPSTGVPRDALEIDMRGHRRPTAGCGVVENVPRCCSCDRQAANVCPWKYSVCMRGTR
jgi:hypothetical protein